MEFLENNTAATCVAFTIALANMVTAVMPSVKGNRSVRHGYACFELAFFECRQEQKQR